MRNNMKRLLVINQHASNHGDEAAGKAFLREIFKKEKKFKIGILYNSKTNHVSDLLNVENLVDHHKYDDLSLVDKILMALTFIMPFFIVRHLYIFGKTIKNEFTLLNANDKIINAPGGVNIGIYKDWRYLWRLYVSIKLKKETAIYSISFGPLPKNIIFASASKEVLKNVTFLSLRDSKSQKYADDLGIDYIKAIDTAFLNNQTEEELPSCLTDLPKSDFVVIVPNELFRWHVNYQHIPESRFNNLYVSIIDYFIDRGLDVVLLPQMFGSENDISYFKFLKNEIKGDLSKVTIVSEKYSSDIQQQIIKRSKFVVGARYHSVIFSVNNRVSFISLAYENKMTNTLELLGLLNSNLTINNLLQEGNANVLKMVDDKFKQSNCVRESLVLANELAQKTAQDTFVNFYNDFLSR